MTQLTAPYSFVPVTETVVFPDWSDRVSQDVPFRDALCGFFDLDITAITPLILGGETIRPDDDTADAPSVKQRARLFGAEVLPGSSIKGMLRSVLEVATFSKMGPRIDDRRYAIRDLHNAALYTRHMTDMFRPRSRAGWLTLDRTTGDWQLRPCQYSLVRQQDLETWHAKARGGSSGLYLGKGRITAQDKYKAWEPVALTIPFTPDGVRSREDWAKGREVSRADDIGQGQTIGTLVFTGQPQDRKTNQKAKAVEFLFHSPADQTLTVNDRVRQDFEHVHRDPNTSTPLAEWDYWRRRLMAGEAVPVFYLADNKDKEGHPTAMGLAMMFRLAAKHSTHDLLPKKTAKSPHSPGTSRNDHCDTKRPDFAETLFGVVHGSADKTPDTSGTPTTPPPALRGRVQIGPAALVDAGPTEDAREEILLSPKAGFYPAYVAQTHLDLNSTPLAVRDGTYASGGKDRPYKAYTTYMDGDARLRGWKRYPATRSVRTSPKPTLKGDKDRTISRKVFTRFQPLGAGSRFRTRVFVHNLRPQELGALIWSITLGGDPRADKPQRYHSLGMGKPLGYGVVSLRILPDSLTLERVADRAEALRTAWGLNTGGKTGAPKDTDPHALLAESLKAFEDYMTKELHKNANEPTDKPNTSTETEDSTFDDTAWSASAPIRHLLAMTDPRHTAPLDKAGAFAAMEGPTPFQDAKKEGSVLPPVLDDPSPWPPQTPPPRLSDGSGPSPAGGRRGSKGPPPPRPTQRGTCDGEPVEILSISNGEAQVRFEDGSIEFIPLADIDLDS